MEKLMTVFAKSKDDIIKDALKEARHNAALDHEEIKPSGKAKKNQSLKEKKIRSFPQQKSILKLSESFHQSCSDLENLITAGLHGITNIVSQKHGNLVRKLKDDLLRYVNNHRHLDQILVIDPTDHTTSGISQNWSEGFHQSCSDLEHFIQTGFENLTHKISQKHVGSINILKEELLNYLNTHHRQIDAQLTVSKKSKKRKHVSKVDPKKVQKEEHETFEIVSPIIV